MPSDPVGDDFDQIDRWTRRVGRWLAVGIPSWLILLIAFNRDLTGIPWVVGFMLASALTIVIVAVADRVAGRDGPRGRLGPFGRALLIWSAVFFPLALIFGTRAEGGAAVLVVPFLLATLVAGGVELARRVSGRG